MKLQFDNPFVLAPMAGITDMPFRRLMKRMGAGAVVSEFVSAHAISHRAPVLKRYLAFAEDERPVGIQLFGGDDDVLAVAAQRVQDIGVDFIDINLGCPVPKVTRKGGGSAWLCHPVDLAQMLQKLRAVLTIPLTIKIRLGWDDSSKNAIEIVQIAFDAGVDAVAIHGRTRAQGYSGQADWDLIAEVAKSTKMPIIGNGDIVSGPLAAARMWTSSCAGVMIGRGALKNPWIFQEAVQALAELSAMSAADAQQMCESVIQKQAAPAASEVNNKYFDRKVKSLQPVPTSSVAEWVRIRADRDPEALVNLHLSLLREVYPEERVEFAFRKFLVWYAAGYPSAKEFRKFVFTTKDFPAVLSRSLEFFESVKKLGSRGDEMRENDPIFTTGHG